MEIDRYKSRDGLLSGATLLAALLAVLLPAAPAAAATIYGTLQQNGAPLANAPVELACPRTPADQRQTDARGSYRFSTTAMGTCVLRAAGVSTQVILYSQPTRYDYELRHGSGGAQLIRR